MLASITATIALASAALPIQTPRVDLPEPTTLRADFNAAKGVPRVVIILSPS